jgi:hypothetical protein
MKTYAVELSSLLQVTAHVVAESPARAAAIVWIAEDGIRPDESVRYQQGMTCLDPDGPTVDSVYEIAATTADGA